MKSIKNFYSDLNLQNKLRACFILLILMPALFIGVVYYSISSNSILDIAKKNILDVVVKNTQVIDKQMKYIQSSAVNLNVDEELFSILERVNTSTDAALIENDRKIRSLLTQYFTDENIITANVMTPIYTFGANENLVIPTEKFFDSNFYEEVKSKKGEPQWIPTYQVAERFNLDYTTSNPVVFSLVQVLEPTLIDKSSGSVAKRLPENAGQSALLVSFRDELFQNIFSESVSTNGAFYCVSSPKGEIVSHTDISKIGNQENLPWTDMALANSSGSAVLKYNGQKILACFSVSETTGWIMTSVVPIDSLLGNVSKIQLLTVVLGIAVLAMAMILSAIFSRRITMPVDRLVGAVHQVGEGNFNLQLETSGHDELQYLTEKFNEMSTRIQTLITENYETKIRQKESEIMALNLQLNPHFLYNTLNIINMMALEEDTPQISKMIVCLSDMLQYTFRNKDELVPFDEEYLWLQNYIFIMSNRFEDKFTVNYQIETELFKYKVPKLLLQPIVENAIVHGFKTIKTGGLLLIKGYHDDKNIYLEVSDNGYGMDNETIEKAMNADYNRIGLSNTSRRLQLIYGETAGMKIRSTQDEGTQITVCFPYKS